jgi:hypothetical protein
LACVPSFGDDERGRVADTDAAAGSIALATILGQVSKQMIHGFIFSDVEQRSTLTPKGDEASVPKLSQMK